MLARLAEVSQIRWIGVHNTSANAIPAFGAMNVTGVDTTTGLIQVNGPPLVDSQEILFCGEVPIPPMYNGIGTRDYPAYALYESGDGMPAVGDQWGAGAGSFKLRKGKMGFSIYGGATGSRVKVVPMLASGGGGGVSALTGAYYTSPTNASIAAGVNTPITWGQLVYALGTGAHWSPVPTTIGGVSSGLAGYYTFGAFILVTFPGAGSFTAGQTISVFIQINNTTTGEVEQSTYLPTMSVNNFFQAISLSGTYTLGGSDRFDVSVTNLTSNNLNIGGVSSFWANKIG